MHKADELLKRRHRDFIVSEEAYRVMGAYLHFQKPDAFPTFELEDAGLHAPPHEKPF